MKKMIVVISILGLLLFTSCGSMSHISAKLKGYNEITIDGVIYLQFHNGATVKYNKDGSIATK